MRVAFLADMLYYRLAAGTTRYAGRLCTELLKQPDLDLRLFTLHPPEIVRATAQQRRLPEAVSIGGLLSRRAHTLAWTLGWPGPWTKATASADLVHVPALTAVPRSRVPLVFTVHDLAFRSFPGHHNRRTRVMAELALRRAVKTAAAFIAVSAFTASELRRITGIGPERIHVIAEAAEESFRPVDDSACLARYGIATPYLLYVGTLEPRKNLPLLLRAYAALGPVEAKLVVVGSKGWMYDEIFDLVGRLDLASRVVFTGFVPDDDLPALLTAATAFVYPSLHEGFGLPVLEAMQCGAPVITSNVSSLPEVAGDAALLVSPTDLDGLTGALRRVLAEPGLRAEMRERSLRQASRFSWKRTAEETLEVYRRVAR